MFKLVVVFGDNVKAAPPLFSCRSLTTTTDLLAPAETYTNLLSVTL